MRLSSVEEPKQGVSVGAYAPPQPAIQVDVNSTTATNDDVVRYKSITPAKVFTTPVTITQTNAKFTAGLSVLLSNSDKHLGFDTQVSGATAQPTLSLVLLPNTPNTFYITGASKSSAIGDAIISVADLGDASKVYATKPATVFWFDAAKMSLISTSTPYEVYDDQNKTLVYFEPNPFVAVDLYGKAMLTPSGLSTSVPPISLLRVGIVQNLNGASKATSTARWDLVPSLTQWSSSVPRGTPASVPSYLLFTELQPNTVVDVRDPPDGFVPIYDSNPTAYALPSSTAVTSVHTGDAPYIRFVPMQKYPARDRNRNVICTAMYVYTPGSASIKKSFKDWCVIYDTSASDSVVTEWLSQGTWQANVTDGMHQAATVTSSDKAVSKPDPVQVGPTANQVTAQTSTVKSSADRVTLTKP